MEINTKFNNEDKISWNLIIKNISYFKYNREYILNSLALKQKWFIFLESLKFIESTIPTYQFYKTGVDDHSQWLFRVIRLFLRAYIEEQEIINSDEGKNLQLSLIDNESLFFHPGQGKALPDLIDKFGKTYDVKHNSNDFIHSHSANYILNYQEGGDILKVDLEKNIYFFASLLSIPNLCQKYDLPENLFIMNQLELEKYFGV